MEVLVNIMEAAAGMLLVIGLIMLALGIFSIVCNWKIFVKMGAKGWASIIPFYCNWVLCERVWDNALVSLAIIIPGIAGSFVDGTLSTILSLVAIVASYVTNWKKYKRFNKSTGFCVLGIFLPIITDAICAFGDATYSDNVTE
jgi:hypothetical protein